MVLDIRMNDVVKLRKQHPCGSDEWRVVRLGADIGLKCQGCGRRILVPRSQLQRQIKAFVSRGEPAQSPEIAEEKESGG